MKRVWQLRMENTDKTIVKLAEFKIFLSYRSIYYKRAVKKIGLFRFHQEIRFTFIIVIRPLLFSLKFQERNNAESSAVFEEKYVVIL